MGRPHQPYALPADVTVRQRGPFPSWFEELAAGRARSLRELAERGGITRRYVRRPVDLAFLRPELVEVICRSTGPISGARCQAEERPWIG
jgi:hypothetical protein